MYDNLLVPNALVDESLNNVKDDFDESRYVVENSNNTTIIQTKLDFATPKDIEDISAEKNTELKTLNLYPIGQVHGTYIIAEDEDAMYILDQHAAHERVNYEMIKKKFHDSEVTITDMLVPLAIELSTSDFNTFMENKSVLDELGFKIEEFGINTLVIKAHPTWLTKNFEGDNLRSIIDLVITSGKNFNKDRFLDSLAKMVSCKMSVKANEHLSFEEMDKLLKDLVKCDNPYNCCHGRPSIMRFSSYELEKMFKRVI